MNVAAVRMFIKFRKKLAWPKVKLMKVLYLCKEVYENTYPSNIVRSLKETATSDWLKITWNSRL